MAPGDLRPARDVLEVDTRPHDVVQFAAEGCQRRRDLVEDVGRLPLDVARTHHGARFVPRSGAAHQDAVADATMLSGAIV